MDDTKNAPELPPCTSTSSQDDEDDDCDLQEMEVESKPLLQLQLTLTEPWLTALRSKMAAAPHMSSSRRKRLLSMEEVQRQSMSMSMSMSMSEKLKASNFPISSITIGGWKRVSGNIEGELTAKIYFAKRKLVWEFLDGRLKSKMEVSWSDIIAIRAVIHPLQPSILEIELSNPPLFFRELTPQPRKHTNWQQAPDFTHGQAPLFRRHLATFPPGELDKHYEKLLQCDQNLLELSMRPFPRHTSPHFDTVSPSPSPLFNVSEEQPLVFRHQPQLQQQYHPIIASMPPPPRRPAPTLNPLITQEVGFVNFFPHRDEMAARELNMINNQPSMWENHRTAAASFNNARFVEPPAAEERLQVVQQQQQQPPYDHRRFCYDEPPSTADEYGCDLDFLPPFYPDPKAVIPTTSYGLSAGHDQVMMMQNDHHHHHYSSMFPSPSLPPPRTQAGRSHGVDPGFSYVPPPSPSLSPPPPRIQVGRSHGGDPGFGYDNGLGDEGLAQILYSNLRVDDDVQLQHSHRDL